MPLPGAADEEMPSPPPARRRRTASPPQPTSTSSVVSSGSVEAGDAAAEKERVRSRLHGTERLSGVEPHLCGAKRAVGGGKALGCDHYKRKCEFYVSL